MLYRVLFHYFDQFLAEYESRFEREYGFFRPIVKEVVVRYLDCGNPRCGFARIRCPDCGSELILFPGGEVRLISGAFARLAGFLARHQRLPIVYDIHFVVVYTS